MLKSVLIDSREPDGITSLDFDVPKIVMELQAGDLIATCKDNNTFVVERKTPSDLLNSIRDNRIFQQCEKMQSVSQFRYLAITGDIWRSRENKAKIDGHRVTGWNWDSVQGALLTVQELGVMIVYGADYKGIVQRIASRSRDDVTIHPTRKSAPMELNEQLLASLPGVGPVIALKVLSNGPACFALDWLSNIYDDYGIQVPGIGWNQKVAIREVLGLKPKEIITVSTWEDDENG